VSAPETARGRTAYPGFRGTIKLVGTGPRGSRALTFDEAYAAMEALLAGDTTDVQAGAFLVAMRLKGETPEELAGMARALRDAAEPLETGSQRPLVACAGAYDGVAESPHLSIAAAAAAAACGAGVVMHCGTTLGPKCGVTQADVLAALGGPARPGPAESARMLEASGMTLVYTPAVVPGWERLARVRDEVGVRGPVHAAERLLAYFGARRFVVGFTHSPYSDRVLGALARLGAERAATVRGIEGSDVLRPGRPVAFDFEGPLELPEEMGQRVEQVGGAEVSARATRAALAGDENGAVAQAVAVSAAVRLYVAGVVEDPRRGVDAAHAALRDGTANAALEALVRA
jgi:anthranilate phosphoribosyltransferase